jgi:hypothetical protein
MSNILAQIAELCDSRHTADFKTNRQLHQIKRLAERNANMLEQILYDYIRHADEPTYRKARLKAAKRMLG